MSWDGGFILPSYGTPDFDHVKKDIEYRKKNTIEDAMR